LAVKKEFREKLLNYCKEAYFFQFDRRDKINARIGVLLAIVAIAANIALKYLDNLPPFDGSVRVIVFYALLSVAVVLGAVAIYNICKALAKTLKWRYPPNPRPILSFIDKAEARNKHLPIEDQIDIHEAFESNLIRQFAEAATENDLANDNKNRYLLGATVWTIASVIALMACAPSFYYVKLKGGKPVHRVELVKPPRSR
jgi:hypothetical protein